MDDDEATRSDTPAKRTRRLGWTVGATAGLAGTAAAALVVASLGSSPTDRRVRPQAVPPRVGPVPARLALAAYDGCSALLAGLRAHTAAHVTAWGLNQPYPVYAANGSARGPAVPEAAANDSAGAAPAHSTTNDQEADVDEPDIVKSDGQRIVSLTGGVLRVIDAAGRRVTGSLDLNLYAGADGAQLLVAGDRALVILGNYGVYPYPYPRPVDYGPRVGGEAGYVLVDLAGAPKILATMQTKGDPVDARLVGSTVRFVVSSTPQIAFPQLRPNATETERLRANRAAVRRAPLSAWLPRYTVAGTRGSRTAAVPCAEVRHPAVYTGTALTTVYTVDLAGGSGDLGDLAPTTVAADGTTVYSTTSSLYVTSTGRTGTTMLHRFDITRPRRPAYLGTGTVPGTLLNSYSLSDYRGHLRVVTTTQGRGRTVSGLYELDDATLAVVGRVGGLGRNENVQAVRFLGDLGYVVTFRSYDPLYVLDLRNPAAPRVAGELAAPGFSSYLHPVADGRLLGVGALVRDNEPSAVKLALVDVSQPARPRQLAQLLRPQPWVQNVDPHQFLYWPAARVAVVPVQSPDGAAGVLVVRVEGSGLRAIGVVHNASTLNGDSGIERSLVIGDTLWTMSDAGLSVRSLGTLQQQRWIAFD